ASSSRRRARDSNVDQIGQPDPGSTRAVWPLRAAPPEGVLRQREVLAAAGRADVLIVDGCTCRRIGLFLNCARDTQADRSVPDPQLSLDQFEIVDVHS